ncbi:MAG: nicotinate-nucleotide adenylyltransferase [Magnetococcales bacterium]|nr:nicotinate-nucleotide adenylyltransferase [Magnetococcales bacterium]HIJ85054.1 nicotinate (nicotinamide) nucleotide adenylyltransferase [Magnetococcales bacterium]
MSRLLGILGGAFNPPHFGHLRAALEAREGLGLEKVLLMPSGRHPFKGSDLLADARHRLAMTGLACAGDAGLELCDIETVRSTTAFTVDTLTQLAARFPAYAPVFLLGSDLLNELHLWKSWRSLLDLAHLCQMMRPGSAAGPGPSREVEEWLHRHRRTDLRTASPDSRFGFVQLPITQLTISSSDIRSRVQSGRSIRFLTAESVVDYIHDHGLYRNNVQAP